MSSRHCMRWGVLAGLALLCRLAGQDDAAASRFVAFNLRDIDTNRNLQYEPAEIEAALPAMLAEAREVAAAVLKRFDRDKDGKLNPEERRELEEVADLIRRARLIEQFDPGRDFQITVEDEQTARAQLTELAAQHNKRMLAELDVNFDGVISDEERRAWNERRREDPDGRRGWKSRAR